MRFAHQGDISRIMDTLGKTDEFVVLTNLEEMRLMKDIIEKHLFHIMIDDEGSLTERAEDIERLEQQIRDIIDSRNE